MAKPRWMQQPQRRYAQVVRSYRRRRLVDVKHRVVFGTREAIERILAKRGWTMNTSFIERLNLDFRQHVWTRLGDGSRHCANTKRDYVSSWRCFMCTTTSCCPMRACACLCQNSTRFLTLGP